TNTFFYYSPSEDLNTILTVSVTSAIVGCVIGLAQWLVLHVYLPNMRLWVLATSVGWAAVGAASVYLEAVAGFQFYTGIGSEVLWDTIKGLTAGALLGFTQYLVLRLRLPKAALWILSTS